MFYATKRRKIVHHQNCSYAKRIRAPLCFPSLNDAIQDGYKLCSCCNPVKQSYQKGRLGLLSIAKKLGLKIRLEKDLLHIHDGILGWIIIYSGSKKKFQLYHQNGVRFKVPKSIIPYHPEIKGYHRQKFSSPNLQAHLIYIGKHKKTYKAHPETASMEDHLDFLISHSRIKDPQHKVSKKHKFQNAKKAKKKFNKIAALNVLDIIDTLGKK